uniref:Uncharacterized protein n=1 Tax=Opuntia streptacantha TaxID=393608 RepID=A0A7C9AFZ1_OPUST
MYRLASTSRNLCSSLSHHLHHCCSSTRIRLLLQPPQMFFQISAAGYVTFGLFASSSMKLKKIPHLFAQNTTPRSTSSALYSMTEKTLDLPTIGILAMGRTAL